MAKITMKSQDLVKGIQSVIYARSKDKEFKDKPLSGICLSLTNNKLNLVSSNTHRLALYSIPTDTSEEIDVIISDKTAKEIIKKVGKKKDVEIEIDNNVLIVNGLEYGLIQGKYPNYKVLYPKDGFDIEIVASKKELIEAINKVVKERPRKEEGGKYDIIKLTLLNDAKKLIITARSHKSPFEYSSVELDVSINFNHFFYEDFIIYFNDRYVQEAITPIETDNVVVRFLKIYDEADLTEFTADGYYSALVMPTRGW